MTDDGSWGVVWVLALTHVYVLLSNVVGLVRRGVKGRHDACPNEAALF